MLLNCSNITKSYGTSVIIAPSSFGVEEGERIGLVGANGAGKTTLFKMLTGELAYDGGELYIPKELKIRCLEQYADYSSESTVIDEISEGFAEVMTVERQLAEVTKRLETSADEQTINLQHRLMQRFESLGGFTYKSRARSALTGLGFDEADFNKPFKTLSGGQKTRVMLCRILLSGADLLLLDEPTNHLDIESTEWLEDFLSSYRGAFIVVSHDRYFLDKVTNKTFEIENGKITCYNNAYTGYLALKAEAQKAAERKYDKTMVEIERIEGIIKQQKQWNRERNIKTAESKQKSIDRLRADLVVPQSRAESIRFSFGTVESCGNDILMCDGLEMSFDGKPLFRNVNMFIKKRERVFLLGKNGCGKTTLLKIIVGILQGFCGTFRLGSNVKIGYYDQAQESFDLSKTPFDQIADLYPDMSGTEVRNALAAFLFRGDDVFKQIGDLSGGERARVAILSLLLSGANFLVLDEPTNHLDIKSREVLENALSDYDGTILAVSHDRYFINKEATKVYYMDNRCVKEYAGDYRYFLEKHKANGVSEQTGETKSAGANDYREKKRLEAEKRKRAAAIARTEQEIEEAECERTRLNELLLSPQVATDYIKAAEVSVQIDEINAKIEHLYEKWDNENLEI